MQKTIGLLLCLGVISCGAAQTGQPDQEASGNSPSIIPQQASAPANQTVTVGPFMLRLVECQLFYEGVGKSGKVNLDFPAPCQFNHDRKGKVRVALTGKMHTLLVESSRPADISTTPSSRDCITLIRGISVTPKEVRLSVQTQKVAQCLPAEWDEKMFHTFSARTQSIDETPEK